MFITKVFVDASLESIRQQLQRHHEVPDLQIPDHSIAAGNVKRMRERSRSEARVGTFELHGLVVAYDSKLRYGCMRA